MGWVEARISVPCIQVTAAEEALFAAGAEAVTTTGSQLEELGRDPGGIEADNSITGLFRTNSLPTDLEERLTRALGTVIMTEITSISEQDWSDTWKKSFSPYPVGRRLWICPDWAPTNPPTGRVGLVLTPGMAFGTGHHETTHLCLEWLEEHIYPNHPPRVLDYGCGSGILAIAALKLGAGQALAVDNDPLALELAQTNRRQNSLLDHLQIAPPRSVETNGSFSLVVANLLARTLVELATELTRATAIGGRLLLSGLLRNQVHEVRQAFPELCWTGEIYLNEWACIEGIHIG